MMATAFTLGYHFARQPVCTAHLLLIRLQHFGIRNLKEIFDFSTVKEFTVEAGRADSITREKLEVLKKYGVTRISVNPQTMHDKTLQLIGRRHTVGQAVDAYHMARELGFDNINMDLIIGLPEETLEDDAVIGGADESTTIELK